MVLRYLKNQVLKYPEKYAHLGEKNNKCNAANKDIRFTIVEYPFLNNPECILLSLQDRNKIKKPFVHQLSRPLLGFYIEEYECIGNDFISGERQQWYSQLCLASKMTRKKNAEKRERAKKLKERLDKKMDMIIDFLSIPDALELYVKGTYSSQDLRKISEKYNVNLSTVYRALNTYFAFGRCKDALIPNNHRIGKGREIPKNLHEAKNKYPRGLGRPRFDGSLNQRVITQIEHDVMKSFAKKISLSSPNKLHQLFTLFCIELQKRLKKDNPYLDWDSYRITRNQFLQLLNKYVSNKQLYIANKGVKNYKNNKRALTSSARHNIPFPTARYEIDSTTLNLYIQSSFTSLEGKKPLKRPTLYTVYDTYSGCVVGFNLTLDGNTEESLLMALNNTFTNKVFFAALHGVKIKEEDWPCHHICSDILFDRGTEFKDKKVTELVESSLGILGVSFTESYMGSNKGTVEGGFKSMQESITEFTLARIDKDKPKSTQHASQKALLTMSDLYKILIAYFIFQNHSRNAIEKRDLEDCINNVEPTPQAIFNYNLNTKANGGVVKSNREIMMALLPRYPVSLTKQSFMIKRLIKGEGAVSLNYETSNDDLNKYREFAYNLDGDGAFEIEVMVLPNWVDHVWYCGPITGGECVELKLADRSKRFASLYGDDIETLNNEELVFVSGLRNKRQYFKECLAELIKKSELSRAKDIKNVKKTNNKSISKHLDDNTKLDLMEETLCIAQMVSVIFMGSNSSLLEGDD